MEKKLIFNSVVCLQCGEQLVSRHIHDYRVCGCENGTMCDGGSNYERHGGKNLDLVQSFCIYDDEPHEILRLYIERGTYGVKGDEELKYIKLKDMSDEHLKAIIEYENTYRPNNPYLKHYKTEQKWRKRKQTAK